jgi:hypothetical protein
MEFQRMQPVALLAGTAYVPGGGPAALISSGGARLAMRPYCPVAAVAEHCRRAQARGILALALGAEPAGAGDPARAVSIYLNVVVPQFAEWAGRDLAQARARPLPEMGAAPAQAELLRAIPAPELPQPSLLVFARFWMLAPADGGGRLRFVAGRSTLGVTGRHVTARRLADRWRQEAAGRLAAAMRACRTADLETPQVREAVEELRSTGAVERGDLLLVAGPQPFIGHILPDHYNRSLHAQCRRSMAICAPLDAAGSGMPDVSTLAVYERGEGGWRRAAPGRGICLGAGPAENDWGGAPRPVATALFLRFAAFRFAANGRFHEHDGG